MVKFIERLTGGFFRLLRNEDTLLAVSRQFYAAAACLEATYARYEKPAYLRRTKIVA